MNYTELREELDKICKEFEPGVDTLAADYLTEWRLRLTDEIRRLRGQERHADILSGAIVDPATTAAGRKKGCKCGRPTA